MLPTRIAGIAKVEVPAALLDEALTNAGADASENFDDTAVGDPVMRNPDMTGAEDRWILATAQAGRAKQKFTKLAPEEQRKFRDLLGRAGSSAERLYLWKAFAACHPVDECAVFADRIRGQKPAWLPANCKLSGETTIAPAVRGELDPLYALERNEAQRAAAKERKPVPAAVLPTARFNQFSGLTGVSYETKKDPNLADTVQAIEHGVSKGVPVPVALGNGPGQYARHVIIIGVEAGTPKMYTIHDPQSGDTVTRTIEDLENGALNLAGLNRITAVEAARFDEREPPEVAAC
jgi:hypothetical protein